MEIFDALFELCFDGGDGLIAWLPLMLGELLDT